LISQNLQSCSDSIKISLTPEAQEDLALKQQQLMQVLKNTLNSARSRQATLEQAIIMLEEYQELLHNVRHILSRAVPGDEPVATLSALLSNIQLLGTAVDGLHVILLNFAFIILLERFAAFEIDFSVCQFSKKSIGIF